MMVKSGLEKFILKLLHVQSLFFGKSFYFIERGFLHKIANSVIKMTLFVHGGISIKFSVLYVHIVK